MTGDLNIVRDRKLRDPSSKSQKKTGNLSHIHDTRNFFGIIMDVCEEYARRWAKKEDVEVNALSQWIKSIADVLKRRVRQLKHSFNTRHESIFSDLMLLENFPVFMTIIFIVPAEEASNNYTFVCKRHYVSILTDDPGLNSLPGNPTHNLTDFSAIEVLGHHKSVLTSFGIETSDDELDLPYIYIVLQRLIKSV